MAETIPISQGIPPDRRTFAGCDILDIDVAWMDWRDAYRRVDEALASDGQTVFAFLNANNANLAQRNPAFRKALANSVVLPDGIGIDIAAKALHGRPFPANLNGTDFVPALLTYVATPLRVAMIGATPDVLEKARGEFSRHAPLAPVHRRIRRLFQ